MNGFDYFKKAFFENYANFNGRARRSEYWYFVLFYILMFLPVMFISIAFTGSSEEPSIGMILPPLMYILIFIIPTLAAVIRRLHDTGRSGWMYLISIIPLIGSILLFIWLVSDSQPGTNQYGPNPKEVSNDNIHDNLV